MRKSKLSKKVIQPSIITVPARVVDGSIVRSRQCSCKCASFVCGFVFTEHMNAHSIGVCVSVGLSAEQRVYMQSSVSDSLGACYAVVCVLVMIVAT